MLSLPGELCVKGGAPMTGGANHGGASPSHAHDKEDDCGASSQRETTGGGATAVGDISQLDHSPRANGSLR